MQIEFSLLLRCGLLVLLVQFEVPPNFAVAQNEGAPGKETSPPVAIDQEEVDALIRQLGSSKRTVRVEAEKTLTGFGPSLLELLPSPDLIRSIAARQAVRRIRIQLEDEAAKQSLNPGTVSLHGTFAVAELVSEIEKQTGNAIRLTVNSVPEKTAPAPIAVDWDGVTFWEALRKLEEAGWPAGFDSRSGDLVMSRGEFSREILTRTSRAFRIRATPLQAKSIDDTSSLLRTRVSIECEPRLRPLFLNYSSDDFALKVGEQSLLSFDAGAKIELPLGVAGREAVIQPAFLLHGKSATAILSGNVSLLLAAAERPIEFTGLGQSAGVARRRGGVTAVVSSVRLDRNENGHSARILIRISYDLGENAFESHQTWVFHNRVWLVAADSKDDSRRISASGFETVSQNETGVGIEYTFQNLEQNPATMSFVYLAPTQLVRVPLRINFDDLPIVPQAGK